MGLDKGHYITVSFYYNFLSNEVREQMVNISFRHVDGGMRAAQRDESLFRLKAPRDGMDRRIIPNVRCISEGDVPVLDAVLFCLPENPGWM